MFAFRALETAGIDMPLSAHATRDADVPRLQEVVEVQWAPDVPESAREHLRFRPQERRFTLSTAAEDKPDSGG